MDLEAAISNLEKMYEDAQKFILDTTVRKLAEILKECKKYSHIAIVGGGIHTVHFINDFKDVVQSVDIIDENVRQCNVVKHFPNYKVYDYERIFKYDCLIISSFEYETSIAEKLIERKYNGKIVMPYQQLEQNGMCIPTEYYNLSEFPYISSIIARSLMEDKKYKLSALKHLIYISIHNRDLLWAKKYLKECIKCYPEQAHTDNEALTIIYDIESELKQAFAKRNRKDIFALWIDALRFDLSKKMPFFNKCRDNGTDFINFYSSAYSTRNTYGCMLKQMDEIDLFLIKNDRNILCDLLEQKGYASYRSGGEGVTKLCDYSYEVAKIVDYSVASTKILWDSLLTALKSHQPSFIIIHTLLETHYPYISPISSLWNKYTTGSEKWKLLSNDNLERYLNSALLSAQYLDMELEYYLSMVLSQGVAILFADHGTPLTRDTAQYKEDVFHLPLCIVGKRIECKIEKNFFNTKRFIDIVESIVNNCELQGEKYLHINGIDCYNKNWINEVINSETYHTGMQYNGIRTCRDMYIENAAGEKFYYILPNEVDNEIDNCEYQERINYLKEIVIRKHIDIYTHPKFKDSYLLYKAQGKKFLWTS